jgi:hypothetical protein
MFQSYRCIPLVFLLGILIASFAAAQDPKPPAGFEALFNGRDLSGWYGHNPHEGAKLEGDKKAANLKKQREEFSQHWSVENGELVNKGTGPYATTDKEYGDIELRIEYKTVAKADSGIYLRGTPQVQIWDWHQVFDPKRPTRRPFLGSGGLFNNTPGSPGRDPLVLADRPFGEWNQFLIRQIGARTWVWLNDKLVVDGGIMENFWERGKPLPERGPIMLQTHGGEIRWRNIFVHEIGGEEAKQLLAASEAEAKSRLASALTLHASFDRELAADFAKGDKACYAQQGKELVAAQPTDDVRLVPDGGRFGGGLHFTKKNNFRPAYKDGGTLGYNDKSWNGSVSVWLKLDPDKDLEPGYCDPVQIVGDDNKKGYIFMEWSKDETPRYFRYAIRPLFHIWNPDNVQWADIPFAKRPMVQVEKAPFSREKWTHAVFTFENINDKSKTQQGQLYLNGKQQGTIQNWDLTFDWKPEQVLLVLGAAYVGHMDDLAVFNRALSPAEVQRLYELPKGVTELRSAEPAAPRASNHQKVMYFVDEQGKEQPVKTPADWERRRKDIVVGLEATFGPLPDRSQLGPVKYQVVEGSRTETDTFTREKLKIESGDGDSFLAWLMVPKGKTDRVPGIIAIHQTNGKLGKDEVAGLGGLKNLHYGLELVNRGYVVIAPDYPTLGEYVYDFEKDRYLSGSLKGVWNHMRCVDLLCAHERVDPERIAAIGHSLGGHNSIFLGVFDPRVQAVVTSCGWTPMHDYYGGKLAGWAGERYAPRIRTVYESNADRLPFDYYELISALAPRGFFTCSPTSDSNFDVAGVKKAEPVVRQVYDLFQAGDRLQFRYPECGHDFPTDVREESYRFLDQILKHRP